MAIFQCWDSDCGEEVEIDASTVALAAKYYSEECYGTPDDTTRFTHVYTRDEDGATDEHTVATHPESPACESTEGGDIVTHAEHSWREEGVTGHGGGVIVVERCRNCDLKMTTDTYAQDASTGYQGLTEISYD